jgi:hypothetical protein
MLWLPAATRDDRGGFPWQVACPTKGVAHTTESASWPDYPPRYHPHATVLPHPGKGVEVRQHVSFDQASYALVHDSGAPTNGAHALQFELVGTCDPAGPKGAYYWPDADDAVLTDLYAKVIRPVNVAFGVKLEAPPFRPYPASYGDNGVRFASDAAWLAWAGWCFTGDMLVTTATGQVPISDIKVGDLVLTDKGRFRPVTAVHVRVAKTGTLVGQGHPGLRATMEHPFLSVTSELKPRRYADDPNQSRHLVFSEPDWVEAKDLPGRYWATPAVFPEADPAPVVPIFGKGRRNFPKMSPELMRLAGRYVADGHLAGGKIVISAHPDEEVEVLDLLAAADLPAATVTHRDRGARQIAAHSVTLAGWLRQHFGTLAHEKSIPTWLLGCEEKYRQAFWEGYLAGDGHLEPEGRFEAKTTSKKMAIGLRLLATSLGYGTALYLIPARQAQAFPGGRRCNTRAQWRVKGSKVFGRGTATKVIGDHRYSRVKSFTPDEGDAVEVFNLTVAEDNTYIADGIVVHNCGHEHVRGGNVHGDPGAFPWARLVALTGQETDMPLTDDDAIKVARAVHAQKLFGSDVTIGKALYDTYQRPVAPSAAEIAAAIVVAFKALPAGTATVDDATIAKVAQATATELATRLVR